MNFIPEEHLRIIYRQRADGEDAIDPGQWSPPGELRGGFEDWCDTVPGRLGELLRGSPIRIPEIDTGPGPMNPVFYYDKERFSFRHIRRNFSRAVRLLEECYGLKDAYRAADVQLLEEAAEKEMNAGLDKVFSLELAAARENLQTVGMARSLAVDNPEADRTVEPAETVQGFELQAMAARQRLIRANQLRVEQERETPNSPYRKVEYRDRLKHKYLHRMNELVQLVEAVKHGMFAAFQIMPTYAVIDTKLMVAQIEAYRARQGLAPEHAVGTFDPLALFRFSALLGWGKEEDGVFAQYINKERQNLIARFGLLVRGKWETLNNETFDEFREKSLSLCATEDGRDELGLLLDRARAHAEEIGALLAAGIEIENDIRDYLWRTSEVLEKKSLHAQEVVRKISLKSLFESAGGEVSGQWRQVTETGRAEVRIDRGDLYQGAPGEVRLLAKGITAELVLGRKQVVAGKEYKDIKGKKRISPVTNYEFWRLAGVPVSFSIRCDESPPARPVQFDSGATFTEQSAMNNAGSAPTLYGQEILEGIPLDGQAWDIVIDTAIKPAAWADVFLYIHFEVL